MKKNKIVFITCIILLVLFALSVVPKKFQNDTFFNIAIGRYIVNNGIDMMDHFNIHGNLEYCYSHWLFDLVIYFIYIMFDFKGIYIFTLIFSVIYALVLYFIIKNKTASNFISFVSTCISLAIIQYSLTPRAQMITFIAFIIEIYCIEKFLEKGKYRYFIYLFLLSVLIANFHAAVWPLYFILFLPYIAENLLYLINQKKNNFKLLNLTDKIICENSSNFKKMFVFFIIMIFSGLLTPIGTTTYSYIIKSMSGNSVNYIVEMQPIALAKNLKLLIWVTSVILISILPKIKIKISDLCLFLGLTFMTLISQRYQCLLISIGIIPYSKLLCEVKQNYNININIKKILKILAVIVIIFFGIICFLRTLNDKIVDEEMYPIEACEYIVKNLDYKKIRIFNSYNYGSVLMYYKIPVFIDSRLDVYCKEFSGTDIFEDFVHINGGTKFYELIFDKYNITHVIISRDEFAYEYLKDDKNYKLLFMDSNENYCVYERLCN